MSCNHANLNIHTTHSTNIDRKTLWHFSLFCDLKSKIQKKRKEKNQEKRKWKPFKNRKRMHLEVSGQLWHKPYFCNKSLNIWCNDYLTGLNIVVNQKKKASENTQLLFRKGSTWPQLEYHLPQGFFIMMW